MSDTDKGRRLITALRESGVLAKLFPAVPLTPEFIALLKRTDA